MNLTRLHPLRWRITVTAVTLALAATIAIGIGASSASAAGPATLEPGADVIFPTWFYGPTKLCAQHVTGSTIGRVRADPIPFEDGLHDDFSVFPSPYFATCISRWWWGNAIKVTNRGTTRLKVYTS
jgi:hypothetical protein